MAVAVVAVVEVLIEEVVVEVVVVAAVEAEAVEPLVEEVADVVRTNQRISVLPSPSNLKNNRQSRPWTRRRRSRKEHQGYTLLKYWLFYILLDSLTLL